MGGAKKKRCEQAHAIGRFRSNVLTLSIYYYLLYFHNKSVKHYALDFFSVFLVPPDNISTENIFNNVCIIFITLH